MRRGPLALTEGVDPFLERIKAPRVSPQGVNCDGRWAGLDGSAGDRLLRRGGYCAPAATKARCSGVSGTALPRALPISRQASSGSTPSATRTAAATSDERPMPKRQ